MGDTVDGTEASQCHLFLIKIKRFRSQTYTLLVYGSLQILLLKVQIACVSGVIPELQRLIFRGRVLMDDQLLSDYHVEGGHTLHLVVTPPILRLSQSASSDAVAHPILRRQIFRVEVETFNFPVQSDHNSNLGPGTLHESQSHSYHTSGRQYDTPYAVIPDSLTFLTGYLNHLRRDNSETSRNSMGNEQDYGPTRDNRIPRPSHLAEVLQTRRQLLIGEVAQCLSNISMLLVGHVNLTDPPSQRSSQWRAVDSEMVLNNLGNSLLELGRATSRISMGERHETSVVARIQTHWPQVQTSVGAGILPLAAETRRHIIVRFVWPSRVVNNISRFAGSESQNAVNTSSPQLNIEEELGDSDSDSEDEMVSW